MKLKKKGKPKKEEAAVEVLEPRVPESVVMPRQKQEGLEADVAGIGIDTLVIADSVYNKELRYNDLFCLKCYMVMWVMNHLTYEISVFSKCQRCYGFVCDILKT